MSATKFILDLTSDVFSAAQSYEERNGSTQLANYFQSASYWSGAAATFAEENPVAAAAGFLAAITVTTVLLPEALTAAAVDLAGSTAGVALTNALASFVGTETATAAVAAASSTLVEATVSNSVQTLVSTAFDPLVEHLNQGGSPPGINITPVNNSGGTSQIAATLSDGASATTTFSGINRTGIPVTQNIENSDGTSSLTAYASDGSYVSTDYSGSDGAGSVLDIFSFISKSTIVEVGSAGAPSDETFELSSASTLQIDNASKFAATIDGLTPDNKLDFAGQAVSKLAFGPNNVLSVTTTAGSSSIQLDPTQNFTADNFDTSPDGNGGTNVQLTSLVGINTAGQIIKVDPQSGATTSLSSTNIPFYAAGGEAAVGDHLYVAAPGAVDTVNLQTGQVTSVSSTASNFVADNATGTLVGVNAGMVSTVDPTTGAVTPIASVPPVGGVALGGETALNGNFYFSAVGGNLYTVNIVTGAYSAVASNATNFSADASTGKLIGVNNGTVYSVDPTTGATTTIASIPGLGQISAVGEAAQGGYLYFDGFANSSGGLLGSQQEQVFAVNESTGQYTSVVASDPNFVANEPLTPVCFRAGTAILTADGYVAVENLAVGDRVVTASGAHRLVKWLGHRRIDCRQHRNSGDVMPIRIAANGFGPNRPMRDLYVSPGHSICVDVLGEVLIPAGVLVNGSTIQQVEVDDVTYWHVELDTHDLLLAENLRAESYLDMGNRAFFAESDVTALAAAPDARPVSLTDYCRPYRPGGKLVEVVREQLRTCAEAAGWRLRHDGRGGLHLVVDGACIRPVWQGLSACFALPSGAGEVWLMSSAGRPCDVEDSCDMRSLGVSLGAIAIVSGFETIDVALDDPRLEQGFHEVENGWRWTAGRARLPGELWAHSVGPTLLRIDLAGPALPRWIAQADESSASAEPEAAVA